MNNMPCQRALTAVHLKADSCSYRVLSVTTRSPKVIDPSLNALVFPISR
jgi:hypothetical protein